MIVTKEKGLPEGRKKAVHAEEGGWLEEGELGEWLRQGCVAGGYRSDSQWQRHREIEKTASAPYGEAVRGQTRHNR